MENLNITKVIAIPIRNKSPEFISAVMEQVAGLSKKWIDKATELDNRHIPGETAPYQLTSGDDIMALAVVNGLVELKLDDKNIARFALKVPLLANWDGSNFEIHVGEEPLFDADDSIEFDTKITQGLSAFQFGEYLHAKGVPMICKNLEWAYDSENYHIVGAVSDDKGTGKIKWKKRETLH